MLVVHETMICMDLYKGVVRPRNISVEMVNHMVAKSFFLLFISYFTFSDDKTYNRTRRMDLLRDDTLRSYVGHQNAASL